MIYFVTGNQNKAREVQEILGTEVTHIPLDLSDAEIQSTPARIIEHKMAAAIQQAGGKFPLLIEDNSLSFAAWPTSDGYHLPGPFVKQFLSIGLDNLVRMLAPFPNKAAWATNYLSYAPGPNERVEIITGSVDGIIVQPRGDRGFGWDPIFQPQGYDQTFAEMDAVLKNRISHRRVALNNLRKHLSSTQ